MLGLTEEARLPDPADRPKDPPAAEANAATGLHRLNPIWVFWIAGLLVYGAAAINAANGHWLDQTGRDLWQHLATLKALIADPFSPANPFVPTGEGSRHYHPYWILLALVARALGWNEWQAIALASGVSASLLLAGIWAFGRAFYRNPWGPFALLVAMVLSWSVPVSHTGFHSLETLLEGMEYPAALLIGLSFLLWALVIRALDRPRLALLIAPLAAFMFATHQLGAGIGFIGAACFILLWPAGSLQARAAAAAGLGLGLLLSAAWPYHSPFEAVTRTGNPSWTGGLPFFSPLMLTVAGLPSLIGLWGLLHRGFARRGLPILAAFLVFAAIFATAAFGFMIGTRFMMPAVLMLHIGVGALLIRLAREWPSLGKPLQLGLFALAATCISLHLTITAAYLRGESIESAREGSAYAALQALTRDIPDSEPVGAYDVAAWPIAATGQRVVSVPWPEPGIANLAERQALAERLFDPSLSREQRLGLARSWGVRHLILDRRGPTRRPMPTGLIERLRSQSVASRQAGSFQRFDLE